MATKRFAALALAGAMLLGSCGQEPAEVVSTAPILSQPAAVRALGLYELHIEGGAGRKMTASVTRVGGGQLSAQEVSGLTFSVSSVTVQDATDPKHYTANLSITNGSGAALNYPLVVPVALTGYSDADSAGNLTYFRSTQDAAGNPITPDGVTIEQATYNNGGTPTPDLAAPRLVPTPSSITAAGFDAPSGSSVSRISELSWLGNTVAAGDTVATSIGFSFPQSSPAYRFNLIFGVFDGSVAQPGKAVISEFRFRGPSGGNDEFIELFNAGLSDVDISGYKVEAIPGNSTTWSSRASIPAGKTLAPGQFYLLANSGSAGYSAGVTADQTYGSGVSDNRAIRLIDSSNAVKDMVGFTSAGTTVCETTCIANASTSTPAGQVSFARKVTNNIIQDTDNNAADFEYRDGTTRVANPQNSSMNYRSSGMN